MGLIHCQFGGRTKHYIKTPSTIRSAYLLHVPTIRSAYLHIDRKDEGTIQVRDQNLGMLHQIRLEV